MPQYLALQIIKGNLEYLEVVKKFNIYKEIIDTILIDNDREDLIKNIK